MKLKTQPYQHQALCLELHGERTAFALTADMGTGKTWIVLVNLAQLYVTKRCDAALVLAPNGVHTNWIRKELPKHMPEDVPYIAAAWGHRVTEQRYIENALMKPTAPLRILTMNWEAMATKDGFGVAARFCESAKHLAIICDESDWMKSPTAIRTKNLFKLRGYSRWRRIMTGTPFDGTPFAAFAQYNFLDPDILRCQNYTAFKAEYAYTMHKHHPLVQHIVKKNKLKWAPQLIERDGEGRPRYKNLDQLAQRIGPYTFRVLKKDCLDLPEKLYKTVLFKLTDEQKRIYKKAEKECRLEFDGEETPFVKLAIATKLSQVTSGYYLHPFANEPVRIEGKNPKLELLEQWISSIVKAGHQLIIWARYTVQIHDIAAMIQGIRIEDDEGNEHPIAFVTYFGETGRDERTTAIDDFESGKARVFVGNQQAGGSGITLVAASYMIYFSNNFSMRDRLQSEDRAHRIGQAKNLTIIDIVAEGTVDEEVVDALVAKKDVSEVIQNLAQRVMAA